jgi:hypothetical protein
VASPGKPGMCYSFGEVKMSLGDATTNCQNTGGFLFVADSQSEINFVRVRFKAVKTVDILHVCFFLCLWNVKIYVSKKKIVYKISLTLLQS